MNAKLLKTLSILVLFAITQTSYGLSLRVVNKPEPSSGGGSSSSRGQADFSDDDVVSASDQVTASEVKECRNSEYMSLQQMRELMILPDQLDIQFKNESLTKAEVRVPSYYTNCLDLEIELVPGRDNNLYLSFKNNYDFSDGLEGDAHEKYLSCMKNEGVVEEGADGYQVNAEKLEKRPTIRQEFNFTADSFDTTDNVNVMFRGPDRSVGGGYQPAFSDSFQKMGCFEKESLSPEGEKVVYQSPENRAAEMVNSACQTGSAREILRALRELEDSEVGNARMLQQVLKDALVKTLENDAEDIYAEMAEVAEGMEFRNGKPNLSREEVQERASEYIDALHKLDRTLINPYISFIDQLKKERKTASPGRKEEIDGMIEKYNRKIREFSENSDKYGYNELRAAMKYYASDLKHDARKIEGFRLKSRFFGNYGVGDGAITNKQDAEEEITEHLGSFDRKYEEFAAEDLSRTGNPGPMLLARRRAQKYQQRAQQGYQEDMQEAYEDYQKCLGGMFAIYTQSKVARCQQKVQRAGRMARMRYQRYQDLASDATGNYRTYASYYGEYQREEASRGNDSDSGDSSDDDFFWYESDEDPFDSYNVRESDLYSFYGDQGDHSMNHLTGQPIPTEPQQSFRGGQSGFIPPSQLGGGQGRQMMPRGPGMQQPGQYQMNPYGNPYMPQMVR